MAISFKNANFAKSTLGADIASGATSLTVASAGDAALFPATGTMRCVIWSGSLATPMQDVTREIVTMTFSATVTFSPVVRARESTSAKAWVTGDNIALVITAGKVDEIESEITSNIDQSVKQAASPTFVGETLSGLTASLPVFTGASKELVSKTIAQEREATAICFRADKNTTAQTLTAGGANDKVTFTNELIDVGAFYDAANSKWVPPAGYCRIMVNIRVEAANLAAGNSIILYIYKNNSALATATKAVPIIAQSQWISVSTIDNPNGSDYYEAFGYCDSAVASNVSGSITLTQFMGEML